MEELKVKSFIMRRDRQVHARGLAPLRFYPVECLQ